MVLFLLSVLACCCGSLNVVGVCFCSGVCDSCGTCSDSCERAQTCLHHTFTLTEGTSCYRSYIGPRLQSERCRQQQCRDKSNAAAQPFHWWQWGHLRYQSNVVTLVKFKYKPPAAPCGSSCATPSAPSKYNLSTWESRNQKIFILLLKYHQQAAWGTPALFLYQKYQSINTLHACQGTIGGLICSISHSPTWQVNPVFICSLPFSFPFTRSRLFSLYLCFIPRGNQVLGSGPQSAFRPRLGFFSSCFSVFNFLFLR